jgi:hypothetical protein
VTLLFFVFVHIAPYLLHKTHQRCEAVRKVLSLAAFHFALCKISGTLGTKQHEDKRCRCYLCCCSLLNLHTYVEYASHLSSHTLWNSL